MMLARQERLGAYIRAACGRAVIIGVDDCYPFALGWAAAEIGRAIDYPRYATREQGNAMAIAAGGVVPMAAKVLAAVPLFETSDPQPGDIGIIEMRDRFAAVIFLHGGTIALRDEGKTVRVMQPRRIAKAWQVPSPDDKNGR